jgi:hypothetical protein
MLAGWSDGDWNDNGVFDSGDLVAALQTGTYEQPQAAGLTLPVPEPTGWNIASLVALPVLSVARRRRGRLTAAQPGLQ